MIVIRLPQKDGTVLLHTFYPAASAMESLGDEIEFWKTWIHDVTGYTVDPDAQHGCSMISLSRLEWKELMVKNHPDDCKNAVRQLAVRAGISIKKPKPKKKASTKKSNERDTPKTDAAENPQPE